jgi:hypothetical protein
VKDREALEAGDRALVQRPPGFAFDRLLTQPTAGSFELRRQRGGTGGELAA